MAVYYNEFDPKAAAWLRELIKQKQIASGDVDERSIEDVRPADLKGYLQCHFFAGVGVWSRAARNAGWPDYRPLWSASCPCQPFSAAGEGAGFADERHLWPSLFHLIEHAKPRDVPIVGEQVASKDALTWIDLVQSDMEGAGHPFGAVDFCAAGIGAPEIRQRMYWMADAECERLEGRSSAQRNQFRPDGQTSSHRANGGLAGSMRAGRPPRRSEPRNGSVAGGGGPSRMEYSHMPRQYGWASSWEQSLHYERGLKIPGHYGGETNGFWGEADWLRCKDEFWRPVEPGTFPLAHGIASRMGRLRGYGNAVILPQAQMWIRTVIETIAFS